MPLSRILLFAFAAAAGVLAGTLLWPPVWRGGLLGLLLAAGLTAWDLGNRGRAGSIFKILDTSVIIDGRIVDLGRTGFLDGILVVPRFVVLELQRIADSTDPLKRNRGRRGLDVLAALQRMPGIRVKFHQKDYAGPAIADEKLLRLSLDLRGKLVTNDINLSKLAGLQGITVLNMNTLANAVKTMVLPGEEMMIKILKEGKEAGQGVGYLDDGTMVVVENGRTLMHQRPVVSVTSVLQTAAGRMVFAKIKTDGEA